VWVRAIPPTPARQAVVCSSLLLSSPFFKGDSQTPMGSGVYRFFRDAGFIVARIIPGRGYTVIIEQPLLSGRNP
jgi:hypothetical protein